MENPQNRPQLSRRKFLGLAAVATTAAVVTGPAAVAAAKPQRRLEKFGFITSIVRKELEQDWRKGLEQASKCGFSQIESRYHQGESVQEYLRYVNDLGMRPSVGSVDFKLEGLEKGLDQIQQLGIDTAVSYWPWKTGSDQPRTPEDCKHSAEILNKMGEICKKRGVKLTWHNHDDEFIEMEEGGRAFDYLMEHTEKDLVYSMMDVYWVAKGGADPVEYLKKYPGRYKAMHLKDMSLYTDAIDCVGHGRLDFAAILREATDQGMENFSVEFDRVVNGMACLEHSGPYLKKLRF